MKFIKLTSKSLDGDGTIHLNPNAITFIAQTLREDYLNAGFNTEISFSTPEKMVLVKETVNEVMALIEAAK